MGLDIDSFLVVAVPIEGKESFFVKEGEETRCSQGHPQKNGFKFCPQDGNPYVTVATLRPKEMFAKRAAEKGYSPEDFYQSLTETYLDRDFGIRCIDPVTSDEKFGFGVQIPGGSYRGTSRNAVLSFSSFEGLKKKVEEEARSLGLEGEALLFCCLHIWLPKLRRLNQHGTTTTTRHDPSGNPKPSNSGQDLLPEGCQEKPLWYAHVLP